MAVVFDPQIGETTPSTVIVAPWTSVRMFAAEYEIPIQEAYELVEGASWLLTSLTQGRITAGSCWVEDYLAAFGKVRLQRAPVAIVYSVERVNECGQNERPAGYCMLDASLLSVSGCGCAELPGWRTNSWGQERGERYRDVARRRIVLFLAL